MISAPQSLDPVVAGPMLGTQDEPKVAFDGVNSLVVWSDYRSGQADIYAARVSATGVVLDPQGIPLATQNRFETSPAVAFDGTNYVVVWADNVNNWDIVAARVTPGGVVLDPGGVVLVTGARVQQHPAIAFGGGVYLLTWQETVASIDLYAARLTPALTMLDPAGVVVSSAAGTQSGNQQVFTGGSGFFVTWEDSRTAARDIYGAAVSTTGSLTVAAQTQLSLDTVADEHEPTLATDGTNLLLAWTAGGIGSQQVRFQVFSKTGVGVGNPAVTSPLTFTSHTPSLIYDGAAYVLTWIVQGNSTDVRAQGISSTGALAITSFTVSSAYGNESECAAAVTGAGQFLEVWADNRGPDLNIVGARVNGSSVLDPTGVVISIGSSAEDEVAIAAGGATQALAVWKDSRALGDTDLWGLRVTATAAPIESASFPIVRFGNPQQKPAVGFDGTQYVVVWEDLRSSGLDLYATRVSSGGVVLDDGGLPFSTTDGISTNEPAIGSNGAGTSLVIWSSYVSGNNYDILGRRMLADGGLLDFPALALTTSPQSERLPALAFDGTNYLVVWRDEGTDGGIYGARVSQLGVKLDATALAISPPSGIATVPAVAFGSSSYLVAWQGGAVNAIYAARVFPDGGLAQPAFTLTDGGGAPSAPRVVFDGEHFVVAWQSPSGPATVTVHEGSGTLQRFDRPDGGLTERGAALAQLGPGIALMASSMLSGTSTAFRATARVVTSLRSGSNCSTPAECATGLCELGTCCRTACPTGSCTSGLCLLDAGTTDAGTTDAGTTDAGTPDAGTPDAGATDAGTPDAGTVDGGADDGGATDGGEWDAGATDAGETDGGDPGAPRVYSVGCAGCSSADGGGLWALLAALGVWRVRPIRSARSPRSRTR